MPIILTQEPYDSQSEVNLGYTGIFYLKTKKQPDMMTYAFNPSSQEAEAKAEMGKKQVGSLWV